VPSLICPGPRQGIRHLPVWLQSLLEECELDHIFRGVFLFFFKNAIAASAVTIDGLGFLAAGLVLATFCMKGLVPLRGTAITSNLAFILYGHITGIEPVLVLHVILLPVNIIRLVEALGVSLPSVLSAGIRRRHPAH
jgi:hypothetical protein